ncbi:hypothetical protein LTR66_016133, partial [Elasticomyces elasticus]
ALLESNRETYEQFIVGMLTNSGAMPPHRITMMLKMVLPGGFPFGEEEVSGVLGGLTEQGRLQKYGEVYGVRT